MSVEAMVGLGIVKMLMISICEAGLSGHERATIRKMFKKETTPRPEAS